MVINEGGVVSCERGKEKGEKERSMVRMKGPHVREKGEEI